MTIHAARVRETLHKILQNRQTRLNVSIRITDDMNLLDLGLVDSLSFLELLTELEEELGVVVDLSDADSEDIVTVAGLVNLVSGSCAP